MPDSRLKVERSLSRRYWCVTLDGDKKNPLYQSHIKEDVLEEYRRLIKIYPL